MTLNPEKCHLLVLGEKIDVPAPVWIGDIDVTNTSDEKLPGIRIDSELYLDKHVTKFCQKASNKLYALARISQ